MIKIKGLYLKLYLSIIAIVILLNLIFHIMLMTSGSPPHIFEVEKVVTILDLVRSHPFNRDFDNELKKLGNKYRSDITVYDNEGKIICGTDRDTVNVSPEIIKVVNEKGMYSRDAVIIGKTRYFFKIDKGSSVSGFISISNDVNYFTSPEFIIRMIVSVLLVLLITYPITLFIRKPLEKITAKAVRLSMRDFSALEDEGTIKGEDEITELNRAFNRMAEELLEMIEEKKEFISDISHELGSPLSRMKIAVETIENKVKAGKSPSINTVEKLSKNVSEMSELVKELLDFSRIDRVYTLNPGQVDPEAIINKLINKFQILMNKKNIKVNLIWKTEKGLIHADSAKLERIIQNLLGNSLRYSSVDSEIDITLRKDKEKFIFSIKDEGPGIAKENGEKIFEPFYREDLSRTRNTGGAGLGLAIVRKLIDLHGGKIWVENPGEKGASITFII